MSHAPKDPNDPIIQPPPAAAAQEEVPPADLDPDLPLKFENETPAQGFTPSGGLAEKMAPPPFHMPGHPEVEKE